MERFNLLLTIVMILVFTNCNTTKQSHEEEILCPPEICFTRFPVAIGCEDALEKGKCSHEKFQVLFKKYFHPPHEAVNEGFEDSLILRYNIDRASKIIDIQIFNEVDGGINKKVMEAMDSLKNLRFYINDSHSRRINKVFQEEKLIIITNRDDSLHLEIKDLEEDIYKIPTKDITFYKDFIPEDSSIYKNYYVIKEKDPYKYSYFEIFQEEKIVVKFEINDYFLATDIVFITDKVKAKENYGRLPAARRWTFEEIETSDKINWANITNGVYIFGLGIFVGKADLPKD